ncbi:prepilin peptidase [Thiomicrospira microaerophila]|nr:prepilin peptidase [Thiomicrospira microaerophila]
MLSWRMPRIMELDGREQLKSISLGGSKCPKCQNPIPWTRLIPVISWLISKGKCHHCHTAISARYPLIELSSGLLMLVTFALLGNTLEAWLTALLALWLLTISIIDFEHKLILDNLSLPLVWLGLLINTQGFFASPQDAIFGAAVGYMSLWTIYQIHHLLTGREGMGFGDFKLTAALGAWLGVMALPQVIVIAAVTSLVISLGLMLMKKQAWQQEMAFGPFLALGGLVSLFLIQLGWQII